MHTGFERVNVPTEPPDVGSTAHATLTMHVGADDDAYVVGSSDLSRSVHR